MTRVTIIKSRLSFLGGLEKISIEIARTFASKGCTVTILTTEDNLPEIEGVEIVSLGTPPKWSYFSILSFNRACRKWLKKHPADLIFGLDRTQNVTHYRAGNGAHKTFLVRKELSRIKSFFSLINPKDRLILEMDRRIFENPDLKVLFTNSNMVKKELLSLFKIAPEKIQVVANGIDFKKFIPRCGSKREAQLKLGLKPQKTQLLFIGNDYKRKGLDFLLKSLAPLVDLPFQLTVIGKEKSMASYRKLTTKMGLAKKVLFLGSIPDLIPYYEAADCFVFPSTYDPCAAVTLEALAMGVFVITSPYNGAHEVIQKGCGHVLERLSDIKTFSRLLEDVILKRIPIKSNEEIRASISKYDAQTQLNALVETSLKYV